MKKKILSLLLVGTMVFSIVACGKDDSTGTETEMPSEEVVETLETEESTEETLESETSEETLDTETEVETPSIEFKYSVTETLNNVFGAYEEDFKFPYGTMINDEYIDGVPMEMDLTDVDNLVAMTNYPRELVDSVDEMSVVMHMMNANIFTGVGIKFADGVDTEAFKEQLTNTLNDVQWLCGSPEVMVTGTIEDYFVYAYGAEDVVSTFVETAMTSSETAFMGELIPLAGYELAE